MFPKLIAFAPILAGLGLMFQQQITAYVKELMDDWRIRQRRKRLERNRDTPTKTD